MEGFDFVIVGGGSAGCVLANRLTADPAVRVLLLEAGGRDRHPYIQMPVGFAKLTSGPFTWGLETEPQKHAEQRRIPYAQGRVIGGSSSINAEVFTRGTAQDFDRWQKEGCAGWAFDAVQPYFLRSEGNGFFAGPYHGTEGPLAVSNLAHPQPLTQAFVQSCQQLGMPYNPDFNGPQQEGAGVYQTTIRNARRCSAAAGYLWPVCKRPNLRIETACLAHRIVIKKGRAVAVVYSQRGRLRQVQATAEVLLTAGAIGSPKLLLLSGIGPADHLREVGVDVLHALPGVGENLQDHFGIDIVYELRAATSLDKYRKWHWMMWAGLQYLLFGSGPAASNVVEGGAFWYADPTQEVPDLQFHFLAGAGVEAGVPAISSGSGCTMNSYTLRPRSRGTVRLRSADVADKARVDPNFLADPYDVKTSIAGLRLSRDIMRQAALAKYLRREHFPGDAVQTQRDLEAYARRYGRTSYHPTCSCKMGDDASAVVDRALRVHGIAGLRVCDSSVMPSLIGSNTNATTIMIAERASDFVLAGLRSSPVEGLKAL